MRIIPKILLILCLLLSGCGIFSGNESTMDSEFAPLVSSITPSDGVSSVSTDTKVAVTFNEEMTSSSVTTNTSDTSCSGTLQVSSDNFSTCIQMLSTPTASNSNKTFTITPSSRLSYGTSYKVRLSMNIEDKNSNNIESEYTTPMGFKTINISVESTSPSDTETSVSLDSSVSITFNEPVDPSTVTTNTSNTTCSGTFQLSSDNFSTCVQNSSSPVASNSNKTFTISPTSNFPRKTIYKIRVTTEVKDTSENVLSSQYESSQGFTSYGIFLALGQLGLISTSSDGTSWTSRISGTDVHLWGSTYGKNTFVIVGHFGTILTSSDGISWTTRTSGTDFNLYGIIYANSIFVAVGDQTILTSSDGISWTTSLSNETLSLNKVIYSNNTFVVVSHVGKILTSSDGISWTTRTSGTDFNLKGITYANSTFVAVGFSGTILTSSDGISWTSRTSGTSSNLNGITYGNSTFVVVGHWGTILTSSDGISWTSRTSGTDWHLWKITYANRIFLTIGYNANLLKSTNGTSWTNTTFYSNFPSNDINME